MNPFSRSFAAASAALALSLFAIVPAGALAGPAPAAPAPPASRCVKYPTALASATVCPKPAWARSKASIKLAANGKSKLTYRPGGKSTFTLRATVKGVPAAGKCAMRVNVHFTGLGWARPAWPQYSSCAYTNGTVTFTRLDLRPLCVADGINTKIQFQFRVKGKSKTYQSNALTLNFKRGCPK